jgi:tetratricopeptide (TPR) repeat protein
MVGRLAMTLAELGRCDEALVMAEDALREKLHRLGGTYTHHWILTGAASAYAGLGRYEEALAKASELEQATRASGERAHEAEALILTGDIQALRGKRFAGNAEQSYRAALEIAQDRGMRPMVARCFEALGNLLGTEGHGDEAAHCRLRARNLYATLGMPQASRILGSES